MFSVRYKSNTRRNDKIQLVEQVDKQTSGKQLIKSIQSGHIDQEVTQETEQNTGLVLNDAHYIQIKNADIGLNEK